MKKMYISDCICAEHGIVLCDVEHISTLITARCHICGKLTIFQNPYNNIVNEIFDYEILYNHFIIVRFKNISTLKLSCRLFWLDLSYSEKYYELTDKIYGREFHNIIKQWKEIEKIIPDVKNIFEQYKIRTL